MLLRYPLKAFLFSGSTRCSGKVASRAASTSRMVPLVVEEALILLHREREEV
jgi:hypothetical protein